MLKRNGSRLRALTLTDDQRVLLIDSLCIAQQNLLEVSELLRLTNPRALGIDTLVNHAGKIADLIAVVEGSP